ncbi:MAG: polyphosphate kinase [Verrucomicrobia bacterium]|nr:polyphosphate kinase [Verrucomicrobiota bacterium]
MKKLIEISAMPPNYLTKKECKEQLTVFHKQLFKLQNRFYADGRFGMLIILQGMDTSGKDGTIRHVMSCINPMGLQVKSFKKPTEEEQQHDFLWRVYPHIPAKSMIQVFNRSYFEDILVPSVNNTINEERINHRYKLINQIEEHLLKNDIHVIKFFLHISKEEQAERIRERLTEPHKRWKYDVEDKNAAKKWNDYEKIYDQIISDCTHVPWNIIPADKRWYRNYKVAKTLVEYLEKLNLKYPQPK